ncbi:hypothetical protein [Mycobacterium marseillense]|uniref:hypothetical protein n=1 Tax=Mycobacterium marseillense TaxID=701042 RepID=UPI001F502D4B|nr:hypothetical protein [Mycobacterium marseillense]
MASEMTPQILEQPSNRRTRFGMMVSPHKLLYSRKEAAVALAMSERRLDRLVAHADILALRDGRCVKFTADELQRYVDSLPSYEPGQAS